VETFATPANFLSQNRGRSPVVRVFTLEKQAHDLSMALAADGRETGRKGTGRKKRVVERRASNLPLISFFE